MPQVSSNQNIPTNPVSLSLGEQKEEKFDDSFVINTEENKKEEVNLETPVLNSLIKNDTSTENNQVDNPLNQEVNNIVNEVNQEEVKEGNPINNILSITNEEATKEDASPTITLTPPVSQVVEAPNINSVSEVGVDIQKPTEPIIELVDDVEDTSDGNSEPDFS